VFHHTGQACTAETFVNLMNRRITFMASSPKSDAGDAKQEGQGGGNNSSSSEDGGGGGVQPMTDGEGGEEDETTSSSQGKGTNISKKQNRSFDFFFLGFSARGRKRYNRELEMLQRTHNAPPFDNSNSNSNNSNNNNGEEGESTEDANSNNLDSTPWKPRKRARKGDKK
jgi:hypothetical protein